MALPTTGPLSIGDIATEFGGTTPHSMSEYYGAGGAPGSGALSISDFRGLSAGPFWSQPYVEYTSAGAPPADGSQWDQLLNGSINFEDIVFSSASERIDLGIRSNGGNAENNIAAYFGNRTGNTFKVSGSLATPTFAALGGVIVRGYASGYISGAFTDYYTFTGTGSFASGNLTISSSRPHLHVIFYAATSDTTFVRRKYFDSVIMEQV